MYTSNTQIRVRYGETDQMGYLYHGNYMLYYEEGRTEAIRGLGITYKELEAMNVALPVVESNLQYLRPAYYDDLITVKTTIEELTRDSFITFHTELYNQKQKLLNKGKTRLVFYDISARKKILMPDMLRKRFRSIFSIMNTTIKAAIITIGDELLIGQVIDTNSSWIAQQLNELGIAVTRRVAVGDNRDAIVRALNEEISGADIILLTGGLGPTSDDITKPVLCEYFGGRLQINEDVLTHVRGIFESRKRPFLEVNKKQAEVPDNCKVIPNQLGTAPGMLFEQDGKMIISMPGVPFEMKGMMTAVLLPLLRTHFDQSVHIIHRNILTYGEGESFLAERIRDIEEQLPAHIALAYLPAPFSVRLRLTATGADKAALIKETEAFRDAMVERISTFVVSLDDEPLEVITARLLQTKKLTLGLAESCTGGYIAHILTQIKGSSAWFKGDIVAYATEVKERILGIDPALIKAQGVVSAGVAEAMALAAIHTLKTDIGLGITGILSEGNYEDRSPVGTIFIAVADKMVCSTDASNCTMTVFKTKKQQHAWAFI